MAEPSLSMLRRRHDDVAVVVDGDRVAVLRLFAPDQPPILLKGTSAAIWQLLDGTLDRAGIMAELIAIYGAPPEVVQTGVDGFLGELESLGLLTGVGAPPR